MTTDAAKLALRLREAMEQTKTSPPELAAVCNVRVPSVYGWLQTGRIAKKHLPTLARHFGRPLPWWLGLEQDEEEMLAPEERKLLETYRQLHPSLRARLLQDAAMLRELQQPPPMLPPPPEIDNT